MQNTFSFYDTKCEIEDHTKLEWLQEYSIEQLLDPKFSMSLLNDLVFDRNQEANSKYPIVDIVEGTQAAIDYLTRLRHGYSFDAVLDCLKTSKHLS